MEDGTEIKSRIQVWIREGWAARFIKKLKGGRGTETEDCWMETSSAVVTEDWGLMMGSLLSTEGLRIELGAGDRGLPVRPVPCLNPFASLDLDEGYPQWDQDKTWSQDKEYTTLTYQTTFKVGSARGLKVKRKVSRISEVSLSASDDLCLAYGCITPALRVERGCVCQLRIIVNITQPLLDEQ
ncbi:MAG: hypothetical protein LBF95_09165 [Treponema sp.]|nr:hypothetical protein [Treponema sp.]